MKPRDTLPSIDLEALERVDGAFLRISLAPLINPLPTVALLDSGVAAAYYEAAPMLSLDFVSRPTPLRYGSPRPPYGQGQAAFHQRGAPRGLRQA